MDLEKLYRVNPNGGATPSLVVTPEDEKKKKMLCDGQQSDMKMGTDSGRMIGEDMREDACANGGYSSIYEYF